MLCPNCNKDYRYSKCFAKHVGECCPTMMTTHDRVPIAKDLCTPIARTTATHLTDAHVAKCVKEYNTSGLRKFAELVFNMNNSTGPQSPIVYDPKLKENVRICLETEGKWEVYPRDTALKIITKQLLCLFLAKLEDDDTQDAFVRQFKIPMSAIEYVVKDVESALSLCTYKQFYKDIWCLIKYCN